MVQTVPDNLTRFLAAYGALLASVGFGWNLYRDLRDRAKVKVSARVSRLTMDQQGNWVAITSDVHAPAVGRRYIAMTAVNVGRRPIVWEGWGGKHKKRAHDSQFAIFDKSFKNHLPKRLEEGESHTVLIDLEDGLLDDVKSFFMWDASGKKWGLSRNQLSKLKDEARKPNP